MMKETKCSAENPATCRYHGHNHKVETLKNKATSAADKGDFNAYAEARDSLGGVAINESTYDYSRNAMNSYIKTAVEQAGAEVEAGPWGNNEHDRSVVIKVPAPEIDGHFLVWLVDRDLGQQAFDTQQSRWVTNYDNAKNDQSVSAWFVQNAEKGTSPRQQAMTLDRNELKKGFSYAYLNSKASHCPVCKKEVPANKLNRVAFANSACDDCVQSERSRLEKPGWHN